MDSLDERAIQCERLTRSHLLFLDELFAKRDAGKIGIFLFFLLKKFRSEYGNVLEVNDECDWKIKQ